LISALILSVTTTAEAQVRFGVKAGYNAAKASVNNDNVKADYISGYHVGPMLEAMVGKGGIGVDVAVLYSEKGFSSERDKVRNSYIEVPLNVKFKFGIPVFNPFVAAGPYVDYLVTGDKIWNVVEDVSKTIKAQSFGAGLNFSLGAELFSFLQLSFNYNLGLTDNYKTYEPIDDHLKAKSQTGMVSIAVMF